MTTRLLLFLIILSLLSACVPKTPLVVRCNQEAEFYMKLSNPDMFDGTNAKNPKTKEIYLGQGRMVKVQLLDHYYINPNEAKITIIARKEGYSDAFAVIQPNSQLIDIGGPIFALLQPLAGLGYAVVTNPTRENWHYDIDSVDLFFEE